MKSFNIDFNWYKGVAADPDIFTNVNPKEWVKYCKEMGADNIWTFCVTYNGYAWYPSKIAPNTKGLNYNFPHACAEEGHKLGMEVFGYFCIGGNIHLETVHPEWIRNAPGDGINMILCDEYLDYFCSEISEALMQCDIDGVVIDWFRYPFKQRTRWFEKEIKLFEALMGYAFPGEDKVTETEIVCFDKKSLENAWLKVKKTIKETRDVKIWTNQPFPKCNDLVWENNILLQQVDYVLNEGPDVEMLDWIQSVCGPQTLVVQNLCGWPEHTTDCIGAIDLKKYGLFGFAAANPNTCLPYTNDLSDFEVMLSESDLTESEVKERKYAQSAAITNVNNIKEIRKIFHEV